MAYKARVSDPKFAAQVEEALAIATLSLEDEAVRRARDGMRRMKFGKDGKPLIDPTTGEPYIEHEYSDQLLITLLRAKMPERYRERVEQTHTVSALEPIEELAKRVAEIKAREAESAQRVAPK